MSYGVRRLAVFAAVGAVVVQLYVTPQHLEEKPHLGVLLLVGSALLRYAAVELARGGDLFAWRVGAVVSAGMVVGFFVSRTGGVPDAFREAGWEAPYGPLALLFKGCYLVLFMVTTCRLRRAEGYIKGEPSAGGSPWSALDAYRRRGGRIDWDDWFRVLDAITGVKPPGFRAVRVGGLRALTLMAQSHPAATRRASTPRPRAGSGRSLPIASTPRS